MATITIKIEFTDREIDDLYIKGINGTTFWAQECEYVGASAMADGERHIIIDEDGKKYTLTRKKFLRGLKLWCEAKNRLPHNIFEEGDMYTAQAVIQFALFGEERYG